LPSDPAGSDIAAGEAPASAGLPVRSPWFERERFGEGITLLIEPAVHRLMRCNVWHVQGRDRDMVVDTAFGVASLHDAGRDLWADETMAVATHFHGDHVGSLAEFDQRAIHHLEAEGLWRDGGVGGSLVVADMPESSRQKISEAGYDMTAEFFIDAIPEPGYDISSYGIGPVKATRLLSEGDVVDLGDRAFEVLELPGHTSGSIGLWEASTGILFSGDAIYDGPLLAPDSDIPAYLETMERLRDLPVEVVHGGHDPSFGRARMHELIDAYRASRV
jgi:glyoxylase-like metal-dependent hydrolase (beta-lactamase superfamily II)